MAIKFRNATSPTSSAQETEVSLGNPEFELCMPKKEEEHDTGEFNSDEE